ncbi:MAG: (Fe-S)-binding protein [Syntrophobacteraceae bacterium]
MPTPKQHSVAKYKAEFLSHYYEGRVRPPAAYAMGYIYRWAQLGSIDPGLTNLFLKKKTFTKLFGFSEKRTLPGLSGQTFQNWWKKRPQKTSAPQRRKVIVWPDTFNNYFWPETARSAAEVLESLSYDVEVPLEQLCCGRPLFDFGLIDDARRCIRKVLDTLQTSIRAGVPVVGLEPSCVSVFRDEMLDLFPHDEDARRLSEQVFTLAEFLDWESDIELPHLAGKALLHGHCHQKALAGIASEKRILESIGLEVNTPDTGCCGMGGSLGWEAEKADLSPAIGELEIFPLVRSASYDTLIVADGFSCRNQIEEGTKRRPLHIAEVLRLARDAEEVGLWPERDFLPQSAKPSTKEIAAFAVAGGSIGAALAYLVLRRRKP